MNRLDLFAPKEARCDYDRFIVAFSGGKDSTACFLHLLDLGIPREKIELWHHDIDGHDATRNRLRMDWPCTPAYCARFAEAFNVPIYFSWRDGGFERELFRDDQSTGQVFFQTPEGLESAGGNGPKGTRRKFPQVSADLRVRWCSAYLKIDVGRSALRNQDRFNNSRTCFITGERAEESSGRARYKILEPHAVDARDGVKRRHVDQWRPVHAWPERRVWDIIKAYSVNPHPAYRLGWGRVSCMWCIFGSPNQWASGKAIYLQGIETIDELEQEFGVTIHRTQTARERASKGVAYAGTQDAATVREAMNHDWKGQIILPPWQWQLPAGAFGESTGPT